MKLIYQNFDKLEVSFKGAFPEHIRKQLADAKQQAQTEKVEEVFAEIGKQKMKVMVAVNGSKGGYAYRFDTGATGEIWTIKDNNSSDEWNIRVSVKSLNLAINGYYNAKERLFHIMKELEVNLHPRLCKVTGAVLENYEETISRVDYCFDFVSDDFILHPDNLIVHSHTKKKSYKDEDAPRKRLPDVNQGNRYITITAGSLPNKQIQIYDKTKEITEKRKKHWFKIWEIDEAKFKGKVWRVELRMGKEYLFEKNNIKKFSELENYLPAILKRMLKQNRYVTHRLDNVTRSPQEQFWLDCIEASENSIKAYSPASSEQEVYEHIILEKEHNYESLILGNIVSYCSLHNVTFEEVPNIMGFLIDDIKEKLLSNPKLYAKRFQKAQEKHALLFIKQPDHAKTYQ